MAAHRSAPRRRLVYALGYTLMATAGIAAVAWPARSVSAAASPLNPLIYVWAAFLILGGGVSAFGAVTDRWIGEYTGLPLLASVFGIYGLAAIAIAPATDWTSLAGGCTFLGVTAAFAARWAEMGAVRRAAADRVRTDAAARKPDPGGGP